MQKKLIALALASLAGSAFAQSNVTIYGVADATFDNVKSSGSEAFTTTTPATVGIVAGAPAVIPAAATVNAAGTADYKARNRVTANSSYIGFKGVEDLGNGLKAVFQYEFGVQYENAGGLTAARDSFVGLTGGFGTVVAGNLTGPTRALGAKMDVNSGATGIGANTALLGKLSGRLGAESGSGAFDTRIANAVAYVSPNFSGFNAVVAYGAAKEAQPAGAVATGQTNAAYTAGLNYENGPFYAGYAYTTVKVQGSDNDPSNHRLGGIFKFGAGQVGLMWDQTRLQAAGGDLKQDVWYLSGKFNVGAGAIIGQYGKAGDVKNNGALDEGAKHWMIGYEHSLSKRTILKALYTQLNNDRDSANDFLYGVSNPNTGAGAANLVSTGHNMKGFSVGVRHSF